MKKVLILAMLAAAFACGLTTDPPPEISSPVVLIFKDAPDHTYLRLNEQGSYMATAGRNSKSDTNANAPYIELSASGDDRVSFKVKGSMQS